MANIAKESLAGDFLITLAFSDKAVRDKRVGGPAIPADQKLGEGIQIQAEIFQIVKSFEKYGVHPNILGRKRFDEGSRSEASEIPLFQIAVGTERWTCDRRLAEKRGFLRC